MFRWIKKLFQANKPETFVICVVGFNKMETLTKESPHNCECAGCGNAWDDRANKKHKSNVLKIYELCSKCLDITQVERSRTKVIKTEITIEGIK